jgi:hypothetical protein
MRNVSDGICRQNQNTNFIFSTPFKENRGVYEKTWQNKAERGRTQMTIWRMRIAYWIPKATDTLTEYVTLIVSLL